MASALVQHGDGVPVFVDADNLDTYLNHGYRVVGTASLGYVETTDDAGQPTAEAIVYVEPAAVAAEELAVRTFEDDVELEPAVADMLTILDDADLDDDDASVGQDDDLSEAE